MKEHPSQSGPPAAAKPARKASPRTAAGKAEVVSPEIVREATDHLTLALFPLATMNGAGEEDRLVLTYNHDLCTPYGTVKQRWTVGAPPHTGLPRIDDLPFLLGLLMLGHQDGFASQEVRFTPAQLFRLLQIDPGAKSYKRLHEALTRLTGAFIHAENAVYSMGGRWESAKGFHLIDEFELVDGRLRGHAGPKVSSVKWGSTFWNTLQRGDVRPLDLQLYLDLKRPTARELFRVLEHYRASGQRVISFTADELAARLGMTAESRPGLINQRLKAAHEQLRAAGVISRVDYARGHFTYLLADPIRADVLDALLKLGFSPATAADLLLRYGAVTIIGQIDGLEFGQSRAERPPAFLVAALRDGYEVRYHPDEPKTLSALLAGQSAADQISLWLRARRVCGIEDDDLFYPLEYPETWPLEMRAVLRFLITRKPDNT